MTTASNKSTTSTTTMGPEPTLLKRKEVDALYETMQSIVSALETLQVDYIVTGGSLLGAIRQHSILFCDDDIDVTIIDYPPNHPHYSGQSAYERVSQNLQELLGQDRFTYSKRPWEAGDKVRPKFMSSVFVDIFTLRRYDSLDDLREVIGRKANGQAQPPEYVDQIVSTITKSATSLCLQEQQLPLCPFWHFNTRKAVELWPKEVYRESELFPLTRNLKMGPLTGILGPRMPVLLLERAFGTDCFDVYYPSASHKTASTTSIAAQKDDNNGATSYRETNISNNHHPPDQQQGDQQTNGTNSYQQPPPSSSPLPPRTLAGGTWEHSPKMPLQDEHYIPMQPISRAKRRPTLHNRQQLYSYLEQQREREEQWQREQVLQHASATNNNTVNTTVQQRPRRTIYMDGVFDMFHIGHLNAIQQCAALGDRVILGVVSDADAKDYKRPPIIPQEERVAIVRAIRFVDQVICPNPLIITQEFMEHHDIDLVVHGFADPADEERQREFFEIPMKLGKFRTIQYYQGLSTTDIIAKIQNLPSS